MALAACGGGDSDLPEPGSQPQGDALALQPSELGESSEEVPVDESASEARVGPPENVPPLDVTRTDVPLDAVVFDTFDGGFTPLSEASSDLIEQLRDAIRPIYDPVYGRHDALPWLEADDLVLGYQAGGQAFAFPFNVLNLRELVNDTIDGIPVLISYCPLCGSAVVYDRRLGDRTLRFGNTSALYESDLVMYDHSTGSYWFQVAGRAIVGALSGSELEVRPSVVATWAEWSALHPEGLLLSGDGNESFADRRYARNPFEAYPQAVDAGRFPFPVSDAVFDERLRASEVVGFGGGRWQAEGLPVGLLDAAVNDNVGDVPVLVFPSSGATLVAAYDRRVDGLELTFDAFGTEFVDRETGSTWDRGGRAVSGMQVGAQLDALPLRRAFWFAVVATAPGVELFSP